ncbi:hypothetical protein H6P81_009751 [Aristolochia fimbriata]|uniref:Large ribosomal subunit protein uL30m n=1 Tax=Aristolochia fimbriata TaxID=158543 RepID=A0AAV7EPG8_ARIFI|nr:hypothetical protein H6P81_009751 [Aristolochia fimbriata]
MNAFKAFKARVPIEWSPHLYITLVRGMPGTRKLHRRTLEAMRLRKCNRTVMRWNTPTIRGMLQQVKRRRSCFTGYAVIPSTLLSGKLMGVLTSEAVTLEDILDQLH